AQAKAGKGDGNVVLWCKLNRLYLLDVPFIYLEITVSNVGAVRHGAVGKRAVPCRQRTHAPPIKMGAICERPKHSIDCRRYTARTPLRSRQYIRCSRPC